jgi:hypothetical protein
MRCLPCGDVGLLVELADLDEVLALHAELSAERPPGVVDLVPPRARCSCASTRRRRRSRRSRAR